MPKKGKVTSYQVDKTYEGLGDLVYIEAPLMGLATNLDDAKREPTHALEIFALPDLKYGWTNIQKSVNTNLATINHFIYQSPITRIVGHSGNTIKLIDLESENVLYSYTFSVEAPLISALINDISFACITNASSNALKIFFWTINQIRQYNQKGNCLAFFKGRLFIGNGKTLIFSGPAIVDPTFQGNPFDSANGGGYILLHYPQVTQIKYLIPYEDMLYIFTDGGLYVLTVSLASNAPSTFYVIEAGINFNFTNSKIFLLGDQLIVLTENGLYFLRGLRLERFDWVVADQMSNLDFTNAGVGYYQGQKFVFIPYHNREISLAYSFEYTQFFLLPFKIKNTLFTSSGKTLDFKEPNYIQKLFASSEYYPFEYLSILHDLGQQRFKYIREFQIIGKGNLNVDLIYDRYALYQTPYYVALGPDLLIYRSSIGRKGYKIGFRIYSDPNERDFAFVSRITAKIHLLGHVNYFYYTG